MFGLGLRRFLGYGSAFSFGNCLKFDGLNDYGTFTHTLFANKHSIEFWIKTTDTFARILSNSLSGSSDYIIFNSTNNVFEYRSSWAAQSAQITGFVITDGIWHHVAIVRNILNVKYYLDGNLHSNVNANENFSFELNHLGTNNGTGEFFAGYIDELRINGNYTMNDTEVSSQYNSGLGAPPLIKTPHASDIFWSFNESNPSTTVADSSGNNKTLTLAQFNYDVNSGFVTH